LKLSRPPTLRGTFHTSWRATIVVAAAVSLTAAAMSQAVLP
jgi:hypothetical protein